MVTNKSGYEHLIEYLTDNLVLFEQKGQPSPCGRTVMELIEEHIVNHIMNICQQHQQLEPTAVDVGVQDFAEALAIDPVDLRGQRLAQPSSFHLWRRSPVDCFPLALLRTPQNPNPFGNPLARTPRARSLAFPRFCRTRVRS